MNLVNVLISNILKSLKQKYVLKISLKNYTLLKLYYVIKYSYQKDQIAKISSWMVVSPSSAHLREETPGATWAVTSKWEIETDMDFPSNV